jgi:hypothetical protein
MLSLAEAVVRAGKPCVWRKNCNAWIGDLEQDASDDERVAFDTIAHERDILLRFAEFWAVCPSELHRGLDGHPLDFAPTSEPATVEKPGTMYFSRAMARPKVLTHDDLDRGLDSDLLARLPCLVAPQCCRPGSKEG